MDIWGTLKGNWDAMGNAKWAVPGYAPYRAAMAATKPGRDAARWLGKKSGFMETDEEKRLKGIWEADRAEQLSDAKTLRDAPWKDPAIREASLLMAENQANMYRQMKSRGNTAAEQSSITGETLSKFNIGGNQKMTILQMELREAKKKEITALKKEDYELAKAARVEQQQITKLIMDIAQIGLATATGGTSAAATTAAMKLFLQSQSNQPSAYNANQEVFDTGALDNFALTDPTENFGQNRNY